MDPDTGCHAFENAPTNSYGLRSVCDAGPGGGGALAGAGLPDEIRDTTTVAHREMAAHRAARAVHRRIFPVQCVSPACGSDRTFFSRWRDP